MAQVYIRSDAENLKKLFQACYPESEGWFCVIRGNRNEVAEVEVEHGKGSFVIRCEIYHNDKVVLTAYSDVGADDRECARQARQRALYRFLINEGIIAADDN